MKGTKKNADDSKLAKNADNSQKSSSNKASTVKIGPLSSNGIREANAVEKVVGLNEVEKVNRLNEVNTSLSDILLAIKNLSDQVSDLTREVSDLETINTLNVKMCNELSSLTDRVDTIVDTQKQLQRQFRVQISTPRNVTNCSYDVFGSDDFDTGPSEKAY